MSVNTLDDAEIEALFEYLDSDKVSEGCLDAVGTDGFLTALVISPVEIPEPQWLSILFDDDAPEDYIKNHDATILNYLIRYKQMIEESLDDGENLEPLCDLIFEPENEYSALREWATAFMEGHFLSENDWFKKDEETAGQLLLPIVLASGLFEPDEFAELISNKELSQQMIDQIPDVITDLYLFYRASD